MVLAGCRTPEGGTVDEKRASVLEMRDDSLAQLFSERPEAKAHVEDAPGYAVFSNVGSKIFVLATGNGYGVVVDNNSDKETYMRMLEVGGGLGIGFKTYRAVFVFNSEDALATFVASGWQAGGDADVGAKIGDEGAEAGISLTSDELLKPISVYQFTDNGVSLSAVATGTKYYLDEDLN